MDFITGAGILLVGVVVGYHLQRIDLAERLGILEDEVDELREDFAPAVVDSIEGLAVDIQQLSANDGELINAYQNVSGRLSVWITEANDES